MTEAHTQNEYIDAVENALHDAWRAAINVDSGDDFFRELLFRSLTLAEVSAGQLKFDTAESEPQVGDKMPAGHPNAGWIYAGISKTTHEPFYVAPRDSGVFQWKEAMAFAAKEGSRLPSKEEHNQLYDAKDKGALKGTFNVTGSNSAGWYRSSTEGAFESARVQRFSGAGHGWSAKLLDSSLRLVR
jgi:hypothetical protein